MGICLLAVWLWFCGGTDNLETKDNFNKNIERVQNEEGLMMEEEKIIVRK